MIPGNTSKQDTRPTARARRDGWTAERREAFLEALEAGLSVQRACAKVGLSREGAYRLRARDVAFAGAWDAAQRAAGPAGERAFMELLAESLPAIAAEVQRTLGPPTLFPLDHVTPGPSL